MSSFFTGYSRGSKLELSPQFWIFCAITAPLTIFILVGWNVWKEWLCQTEPGQRNVPARPNEGRRSVFDRLPLRIQLPTLNRRNHTTNRDLHLNQFRPPPSSTPRLPPKLYAEGEERLLPAHNEVVRPPTGHAPYLGIQRPFEIP